MKPIALRNIFLFAGLAFSTLCLAAGYVLAGQWLGAVISILTGLAWLYARKDQALWMPQICLLASVCLAVAGLLSGVAPVLMLLGSGFALAVWDLALLEAALKNSTFNEQTRRYENKHLQSLSLALGFGLLVTILGRWLHFQLPFIILLLFVALVILGLDRIWGYIKQSG